MHSDNAYLTWSSRQKENTGIDTDTFASTGGGSVNLWRKITPRQEYSKEAKVAFKAIDDRVNAKHSNLLTPESIAQEKRLDEYHANCDKLGKEKATEIYNNTPLLAYYDSEVKAVIIE